MVQNEGETDRLIRVVVGAVLFLVGYSVGEGVWATVLYLLSGVLVVTSFSGFCLIYKLLGISTIKK